MPRRELAAVLLGAIVLTAALTWPTVARFGSAGRVHSGDGRYSIWNVAWVAHALTTSPAAVFDANIFHPHQRTLAYSEANLVAGALGAPVWWLTGGNPYATLNAAAFAGFVLAFVVTYGLGRRLTGSRFGAAFGAIAFAFCPFVFAHTAHIQLLMTFGLPLAMLAMHVFVDAPSPGRAAALGGALALAALACGYYGIFAGLAAGLGVVWFGVADGRWRNWRYWAMAGGAAAVAGLLVAPAFLPYLDIRDEGFRRSLDDARRYAATWRAYLASAGLLHRWMLPWLDTWREVLFPGFLPVIFGGLAVWWARRPDAAAAPGRLLASRRAVVGFYATLGLLALWASTGPAGGLYLLLHETLPFFSMLRAPARFGVVVMLALAVLGGVAVAALERRLSARRRTPLLALLLAAAVADSTVGAVPFFDAPTVPAAVRRLALLPRAPVAEFPYFSGQERHRHTEYMLLSAFHWQPLVNGYSDHMPPAAAAAMTALATFPRPDAWRALREHRVRYVLVHWRLYDPAEQPALREALERLAPHLRAMVEEPDVTLYEVIGWP